MVVRYEHQLSSKRPFMHIHMERTKIIMLPSKDTGSHMKTIQLTIKLVFTVAYIDREFVSEMKMAEGLYVMVVRSLGIEKIEEKEKPKIVIHERVQPLLVEFSELMSDDLTDSLSAIRDIEHHIDLVL